MFFWGGDKPTPAQMADVCSQSKTSAQHKLAGITTLIQMGGISFQPSALSCTIIPILRTRPKITLVSSPLVCFGKMICINDRVDLLRFNPFDQIYDSLLGEYPLEDIASLNLNETRTPAVSISAFHYFPYLRFLAGFEDFRNVFNSIWYI